MCTILKKAGLALSVILVLFAVLFTLGCSKKPKESEQPEATEQVQKPATTFSDQAARDKEKLLTLPQPAETQPQPQPTAPATTTTTTTTTTPAVQPAPAEVKPAVSKTFYFKELDEIDQVEAERLLNVAVPGRSIGRLPMTSYSLMVSTCRQIIQKWPESVYAYRAKQMMAQLPDQSKQTYTITEQEIDVSMYAKPRTGTQPYTVKE